MGNHSNPSDLIDKWIIGRELFAKGCTHFEIAKRLQLAVQTVRTRSAVEGWSTDRRAFKAKRGSGRQAPVDLNVIGARLKGLLAQDAENSASALIGEHGANGKTLQQFEQRERVASMVTQRSSKLFGWGDDGPAHHVHVGVLNQMVVQEMQSENTDAQQVIDVKPDDGDITKVVG